MCIGQSERRPYSKERSLKNCRTEFNKNETSLNQYEIEGNTRLGEKQVGSLLHPYSNG